MRKRLGLGIVGCLLLAFFLSRSGYAQRSPTTAWVKLYDGSNVTNLFLQDDKTLWAVGENAVILSSKDAGRTWEKHYEGGFGWLTDIFMSNHQTGWAVGSGGMILATTDGGKNWARQQGIGPTDYNCVSFSDSNHGFIGAGAGMVLHTEDGGKKWTAQQFKFPAPPPPAASAEAPSAPPPANAMRHLAFTDSSHVIVLKDNDGVMISGDSGKNWKTSSFPQGFSLDELYTRGRSAWLAGGRKLPSGTVIAALWYSPDSGHTWKPINTAKPLFHSIDSLWFADEQNGIISVDGRLYRTTDGGVNWAPFYSGDEKVRRIFARDADHIWAIIGGNIYVYVPSSTAQANPSQ